MVALQAPSGEEWRCSVLASCQALWGWRAPCDFHFTDEKVEALGPTVHSGADSVGQAFV